MTGATETLARWHNRLRCPVCRGALCAAERPAVECVECRREFAFASYGPDLLLPDQFEPDALQRWRAVLDALSQWRARTWTGSAEATAATARTRTMAEHLLAAAGVYGDLLDVGCGSGWMREPAAARGCVYHGLDPMPLADTFPFPFARAVSDRLPVATGTFDSCLFFASLDYSLDPRRALEEAGRVLRRGGVLAIATPVHESASVAGERLHNHRFLPGQVAELVSDILGCPARVLHPRDRYEFVWTSNA